MITRVLRRLNQQHYPGRFFFDPKWIVLGVNNVCNLRCKMCDVGTGDSDTNFAQNLTGTRPLNMPVDLIKRVIDQTAEYFPRTKIGYAFTEPLVYPHLAESLSYAKSKRLYTSITTNALTLKQKAQPLVDARLDELNVSLDGPPEIHNQIRGHEQSYERAIAGIEELLRHSTSPSISIFCVITQWNIGHLKRFADGLKDYPLRHLGFMHYVFTTSALAERHNEIWGHLYPATHSNINHDSAAMSPAHLDLLWNELQFLRSSHYPFSVGFSPEIETRADLERFYLLPDEKFGSRCGDVSSTLMIKSDGSAIPAHGRCYNLTVGNVYRESLEQIWNAPVLNAFRKDLHKAGGLLPACSRCCSAFH